MLGLLKPAVLISILFLALIFFAAIASNHERAASTMPAAGSYKPPGAQPQLVAHHIARDDSNRNKLIWRVVLDQPATKDQTIAVLDNVYHHAVAAAVGRPEPPMIAVYVYASIEHLQGGDIQWAVERIRYPGTDHAQTNWDERFRPNMVVSDMRKFGLTGSQRQDVWRELVHSHDRARREATSKYPAYDTRDERQIAFENRLIDQYESDLCRTRGITLDQLHQIIDEARASGWPMPTQE